MIPIVHLDVYSCLVVDCGHPGNITNGRVDISDGTNMGEWIRYSCVVEYILNGSSWRACQSNGAWSGSEPTCEGEINSEWWLHMSI